MSIILYPNSTLTGVSSASDVISKSIYSAKGNILVATASANPVTVPVGTDGYMFVADSTQVTGVNWKVVGVDLSTITATASTDLNLNAGSGNQNINLNPTGSGKVIINGGTSVISSAAGQYKLLFFSSGTSSRWAIYTDNTAESGSQAGSNFVWSRYNDSGSYISDVLSITRSSGAILFPGASINMRKTNIGITSATALSLSNDSSATVGAQQFSPRLQFSGAGWKTNATAGSQPVDFGIELKPVQSTVSPTGILVFSSQINNAGFSNAMTLTTDGILSVLSTTETTGTTVGSLVISGGVGIAKRLSVGGNIGIGVAPSTSDSEQLKIAGTNTTGYTQVILAGTGHTYQMGVGNATEFGYSVANKWYLFDLGGNAMRLVMDTSGNFGIGTASPGAPLAIGSSSGTALTNLKTWIAGAGGSSDTVFQSRIGIGIDSNMDYGGYIAAMKMTGGTASDIVLALGSRGAGTDHSELFLRNGSVGIGTATPGAKLSFSNYAGGTAPTIAIYEDVSVATGFAQGASEFRIFGADAGTNHISFGKYTKTGPTFTEQVRIDINGNITMPAGGSLSTGTPSGGTSAAWKLGILHTGTTVSLDTTKYVELDVGGTLVKVGIVS